MFPIEFFSTKEVDLLVQRRKDYSYPTWALAKVSD